MSDTLEGLLRTLGANRSTFFQDYLSQQGIEVPKYRGASARSLKVPVGFRVAYAKTLEAVLASGPGHPSPGDLGTVVMVRTATGDRTSDENRVFVRWDSGKFCPVDARYLVRGSSNVKMASAVALRPGVTSLDDFLKLSSDSNDLIHTATRDLWTFGTSEDGEVILARLFQEDGNPLKV